MNTNSTVSFFSPDNYFIDEKVGLFKFSNAYKLYNDQGVQIGNIVQNVPGFHKVLRLIFNKQMMPFMLDIKDMNDNVQVTIQRGWTFWMSKISISDASGNLLGKVSQKFRFFKPNFEISDSAENTIARITGDWKAWNFSIENPSGNSIGSINKKWAGAMKEIFTTADKYHVSIVPEYKEDFKKVAILASAITIDMVFNESK
ncbi:LURP-one-related/scramblase family protein [Pinibacter soli]|uniref:Phospholipid scramblase-related protein n=1 Tax=Pinibacter soli TaxID=3044211 RepID=A0ABT6R6W8_9BACT|nr:phospholipid scramblase-related protein [Pinibacter soli]MDI3318290.1 phospholipid scramblase-related protein [Pinibacter soli]